MTDIVKWLRHEVPHCDDPNNYDKWDLRMLEAADEIEQLREALSAMTELFKATEASAQWALSEVQRLRKALKFYSCLCDDDSDLFNCPYDKADTNRCGWKARSALGKKK